MVVGSLHMRDTWYAKALLPVFLHDDCEKIERIPRKRACYRINGDRLLTVKKSRTSKTTTGRAWLFNFSTETQFLNSDCCKSYVFLVCDEKVSVLERKELMGVFDPNHPWLRIICEDSCYSVSGFKKGVTPLRTQMRSRGDILNYFFSAR
jgi:hypothetical protein